MQKEVDEDLALLARELDEALRQGRGGERARFRRSHERFDFVLANPPFNLNNVDKDRLRDAVGSGRRYPFGLPKPDNGNYRILG